MCLDLCRDGKQDVRSDDSENYSCRDERFGYSHKSEYILIKTGEIRISVFLENLCLLNESCQRDFEFSEHFLI